MTLLIAPRCLWNGCKKPVQYEGDSVYRKLCPEHLRYRREQLRRWRAERKKV